MPRTRSRRGVFRTARAVLGTLGIALALPLLLVAGLVLIPLGDLFSGRHRLGYEIGRSIIGVCWRIAGIRVEEVDRKRVEPMRTRVYMPNHESLLDMPQVLYLLPGANGTLIKKEAFRVPLVGWAFRAVGFTPVDRANPVAARESLARAVEGVRAGRSLVIAPEGTRSRTGKLGPFKVGGFRIAIRGGVPIAPVTVSGARDILPPGSFLIYSGVIRVRYHDPVETAGMDPTNREHVVELVGRVRQAIERALPPAEPAARPATRDSG